MSVSIDLSPTEKLNLLPVSQLLLDPANPRLPDDIEDRSQDGLTAYLANNYNAIEVAESIAKHGFFGSEPLIAVPNNGMYTVVEGNRRLSALKILASPELRNHLDLDEPELWSTFSESDLVTETVPVVLVEDRDRVAPIIGFRHMSGIVPWEAWQQAKFTTAMLNQGKNFDEVAELTGIEKSTVRAQYRNHEIVEQAEDDFGIDPSRAINLFGNFTRAMTSTGIRSFISAPAPGEVVKGKRMLPASELDDTKDLFSWMFGDEKNDAIISDSRQLTQLGAVLTSEEGTKVLRQTRNLQEALEASGAALDRVVNQLNQALKNLQKAEADIGMFKENPQVIGYVDDCVQAVENLRERIQLRNE